MREPSGEGRIRSAFRRVGPSAPLFLSAVSVLTLGLAPVRVRSLQEWTDWRDRTVQRIFEPVTDRDGESVIDWANVTIRSAEAARQVRKVLDSDPSALDRDPLVRLRMANFLRFVDAQALMAERDAAGTETHRLGLDLTDQEYGKAVEPFVRVPALLQSQPFLRAMSSPPTYADAVRMIESKNEGMREEDRWKVLFFRGRFIKSVDQTTYGRMLVFAPGQQTIGGATVDQWVQFAIATPDVTGPLPVRSVSVVAVTRPRGSEAAQAYFMDYMRALNPGTGLTELVPTVGLPKNPSKNCYECHKSAVLPIHPGETYTFDAKGRLVSQAPGQSTVAELNERAEAYGRTVIDGLDTGAYGPGIGALGRDLTDESVRTAARPEELSDRSVARIRAASKCGQCHDRLGPVNFPLSARTTRDRESFVGGANMVRTSVESGWMPPHNDLSATERAVLWTCLSRDYLDPRSGTGAFFDWIKSVGRQP